MKELLRLNSLLKHVIDVYLRAASADSGPPQVQFWVILV